MNRTDRTTVRAAAPVAACTLLLMFVLAGLSLQSAVPMPHYWPQRLHDAQNSSRSPYPGPATQPQRYAWNLFETIGASMALDRAGTLFVTHRDSDTVLVRYPFLGTPEFIGLPDCGFDHGIARDGAHYFVCTPTGTSEYPQFAMAVEPNGELRWIKPIGEATLRVGDDDSLCLRSRSTIEVLRPDGTRVWRAPVAFLLDSVAVHRDGSVVYVERTLTGSDTSRVTVREGRSGVVRWRRWVPSDTMVNLVVAGPFDQHDDGVVIVSRRYGEQAALIAFDMQYGSTRWEMKRGEDLGSNIALGWHEQLVVLVKEEGRAGRWISVDVPTGNVRWERDSEGLDRAEIIVDGADRTYAVGLGIVQAIGADGDLLWEGNFPTEGIPSVPRGIGPVAIGPVETLSFWNSFLRVDAD